jgi:hypothetical protein
MPAFCFVKNLALIYNLTALNEFPSAVKTKYRPVILNYCILDI